MVVVVVEKNLGELDKEPYTRKYVGSHVKDVFVRMYEVIKLTTTFMGYRSTSYTARNQLIRRIEIWS